MLRSYEGNRMSVVALAMRHWVCGTFRCRSCDFDISCFVSKYYGVFNNIMRALGSKRNETVAVYLMKPFCLPTLLYGCEIWHARAADVRSASVAWNNGFRKIFNIMLAWVCETFTVFLLMPTSIFPHSSAQITLLEEVSIFEQYDYTDFG